MREFKGRMRQTFSTTVIPKYNTSHPSLSTSTNDSDDDDADDHNPSPLLLCSSLITTAHTALLITG